MSEAKKKEKPLPLGKTKLIKLEVMNIEDYFKAQGLLSDIMMLSRKRGRPAKK